MTAQQRREAARIAEAARLAEEAAAAEAARLAEEAAAAEAARLADKESAKARTAIPSSFYWTPPPATLRTAAQV